MIVLGNILAGMKIMKEYPAAKSKNLYFDFSLFDFLNNFIATKKIEKIKKNPINKP